MRLPQAEYLRLATAPLRRYADLVSQRQLCAALTGQKPLGLGEVAALELWIKRRGAEIKLSVEAQQATTHSLAGLRELEVVCAKQAAESVGGKGRYGVVRYTELDATVLRVARPRVGDRDQRHEVVLRLSDVEGMQAYARWAPERGGRGGRAEPPQRRVKVPPGLQPGRPVRVRLRSVDAKRGRVDVDIIPLSSSSASDGSE